MEDLVFANSRLYEGEKYDRFVLFLEDKDAMPYTVFDRVAKRYVLPTISCKKSDTASLSRRLQELEGSHVELLYNAYGFISEVRSI